MKVYAAGDTPGATADLVEFFDFEDDEQVAVAGEGFAAFLQDAVGVVVDGLFGDPELLGDDRRRDAGGAEGYHFGAAFGDLELLGL